jgi:hypothetical protein
MKTTTKQEHAAKSHGVVMTLTSTSVTVIIPKRETPTSKPWLSCDDQISHHLPFMGHTREGGLKAKHIRTETATEIIYQIDPLSIADKFGLRSLSYLVEGIVRVRGIIVITADAMHLNALQSEWDDVPVWAAEQADDTYAVGMIAEIMPLI